jgi:CheY-like chemotaxis protein
MEEFHSGTPHNGPRCDMIAANGAAYQWAPMRLRSVLVVEDDWLLRQALVEGLTAEDCSVLEAESGETALLILNSGETVDLLITDVRLGGKLDGWDVADALRASNPQGAVIYLSGNPVLESRQVTKSVFLSKPYQIDRLLNICRKLFSDA